MCANSCKTAAGSLLWIAAGRCTQLNNSAYTWGSGTSFAAPHVAGTAAIYLGNHPSAKPAEVKSAILTAATQSKITGIPSSTPNRLLYSLVGDVVPEVVPGPPVQAANGQSG